MSDQLKLIQGHHRLPQNVFDNILNDPAPENFHNSQIQKHQIYTFVNTNDQNKQNQLRNQDLSPIQNKEQTDNFPILKKKDAKEKMKRKDRKDSDWRKEDQKIRKKKTNKLLKAKSQAKKIGKNFHQFIKSIHVQKIKKIEKKLKKQNSTRQYPQDILKILQTPGRKTDYKTFYEENDYRQTFRDMFNTKFLYRKMMIINKRDKQSIKLRRIYQQKITALQTQYFTTKDVSACCLTNPTQMESENIDRMEKQRPII